MTTPPPPTPVPLSDYALSDDELRDGLQACLAVPRWVDEVMSHAPFSSLAELLDVAAAAATPLRPGEIDQALAHHPRIGAKVTGDTTASTFSRAEQQSSASEDAGLAQALAAGNAAYEERFGRVFLIRAAGRSRAEILQELQRRMGLSDEEEEAVVASELRDIALARIPQLFGLLDSHSAFDGSDAAR